MERGPHSQLSPLMPSLVGGSSSLSGWWVSRFLSFTRLRLCLSLSLCFSFGFGLFTLWNLITLRLFTLLIFRLGPFASLRDVLFDALVIDVHCDQVGQRRLQAGLLSIKLSSKPESGWGQPYIIYSKLISRFTLLKDLHMAI